MKTSAACIVILFLTACVHAQSTPAWFISLARVSGDALPGQPVFTLTVNGAGFASGSGAHWEGSSGAPTFISSSKLSTAITAADIANASTTNVTVVNPAP